MSNLLNWRSGDHFDHSGAQPCVCCKVTTPLRSHAGEPVHKVCAEDWNDRNPQAPRVYANDADPSTRHDLGTTRFHSDQPKKRGKGDHA
ncbi:hypothetical protein ACFV42_40790 [Streptomyces solisilvae]|uniref:hypothetical protein n=1 Tax=Streptomyces malaysiensis TaxID=92644 RepID=UPI0036C172AD